MDNDLTKIFYDPIGILYRVTDFGGSVTETRELETLTEWVRTNHICARSGS